MNWTIAGRCNYYTIGTEEQPYFHEERWDLDYDTIVAKYTSEGIYIYLEATGDNNYEFSGLVDRMELSKDDVVKDRD